MASITIPNGWAPRPYQRKSWDAMLSGIKRIILAWHRRSGKDSLCLNYLAYRAIQTKGNYWYMLPKYSQARKAVWTAIDSHTGLNRMAQAFPDAIRAKTNQQEMMITLVNGSTVQLVGSDTFDALVGSPPVGIIFSEYALNNPAVWSYLQPILEENNGWALFNSTPRGKNHFYSAINLAKSSQDWYVSILSAHQTGVFSTDQLETIKSELIAQYGDALGTAIFNQEYLVSFDSAIAGAIYGTELAEIRGSGRIYDCPYNPTLPVHCTFDLGSTDATAIWFFQVYADKLCFIDYHESTHKSVDFYCDLLKNKGYNIGNIYLPHDAAQQHLAAGGKSIKQQVIEANVGTVQRVPHVSVQDGIQAVRATSKLMHFDAVRCAQGIEAMSQYHNEYDATNKTYGLRPKHDWASNGMDSMRYACLVWRLTEIKEPKKPINDAIKRHLKHGKRNRIAA